MIEYLYLGRIGYGEALELQQKLVELRHEQRIGNVLLLLEHPPVLTLGRNAGRENVLASDEMLARRGVTLYETKRGGDVTYHGPGQLVGYPIFDLRSLKNPSGARMGPVDLVRRMEEALMRLCAGFGVETERVEGRTGVWCPATGTQLERKIAAIGIHVSRGITSHGFALNVTTDLRDFDLIIPCGIGDRGVTSLELAVSDPTELPTLEVVAHRVARCFGQVLDASGGVLAVDSLESLLARALPARPEPRIEPSVTHDDTPLQIPREVERLISRDERPSRA